MLGTTTQSEPCRELQVLSALGRLDYEIENLITSISKLNTRLGEGGILNVGNTEVTNKSMHDNKEYMVGLAIRIHSICDLVVEQSKIIDGIISRCEI